MEDARCRECALNVQARLELGSKIRLYHPVDLSLECDNRPSGSTDILANPREVAYTKRLGNG